MKILITGATGFVGSHLAEILIKSGHQVFAQIRDQKKWAELGINTNHIVGSINNDSNLSWLNQLPDDLDVIVHSAAQLHSFHIKNFYNTNFYGTKKFFDILKEKYKNKNIKFIFVSSLSAAGPSIMKAITEADEPKPVSHYGKSKLMAENYLKDNLPENWQLAVIRPPMVIGPRDTGVLDIIKMINFGVILLPGKGAENRCYSFICIFDLIQMVEKIIVKPFESKKEVYFAAHPHEVNFATFVDKIKSHLNIDEVSKVHVSAYFLKIIALIFKLLSYTKLIKFNLTPDKTAELLAENWVCSGARSEQDLEMKYEWNLDDTLKITIKDYQKKGWI